MRMQSGTKLFNPKILPPLNFLCVIHGLDVDPSQFCVVLSGQICVRFCQVMIFVPHEYKPNCRITGGILA